MTYRTKRLLSLLVLLVGLPVYIVVAITVVGWFGRPPIALEAAIYLGLGFLWVLFTGEINRQLQQTGQSIASYIYEIVCYLTFNSQTKPFPFGAAWPSSEADSDNSSVGA